MRQNKKVIASKRIAGLPLFAVPVAALERRVVARPLVGIVSPGSGSNSADADFVRGFIGSWLCGFRRRIAHVCRTGNDRRVGEAPDLIEKMTHYSVKAISQILMADSNRRQSGEL